MGKRITNIASPKPPAPPSPRPLRRDPAVLIGLIVLVIGGLWLQVPYVTRMAIPFADTHTYLEVGRNLLEGRGFVTRFNVVYGWSGELSHPGLAYYNPLYGLALGAAWQVLKDPGRLAVAATVVPCVLNVVLLVVLVCPALGRTTALLSGAGYLILPSTHVNITLITAEHLLVTLCLVLLLIVQRLVPRARAYWALVGAVLGVGALVKVTILGILPALIAGILLTRSGGIGGRVRASVRPVLLLLAGAAVVLVPFNIVCKIAVGRTYPEYPLMARVWSMADTYGGEFVEGSPAIRPDAAALPGAGTCVGIVAGNFRAFLGTVAADLGLLTLAVAVGVLAPSSRRPDEVAYLFCFGGAFLITYSAAYYWLPFDAYAPARYALHVVAFWYPLGLAGLVGAVRLLCQRALAVRILVPAVWLLACVPAFCVVYQNHAFMLATAQPRSVLMQRMASACRDMTAPDDLIAVEGGGFAICSSMFLERPVVPLPQKALDNEHDMRRFLAIFHPKLVVPGACQSAWKVLPEMGYQTAAVPSFAPGRGTQTVFVRTDR